jgi:hypothetical protein
MRMSLVYRRVDMVLSGEARCEVREGDCLLIETDGDPRRGELTLVRRGGVEVLCRWRGEGSGETLGLVVGIKRRL